MNRPGCCCFVFNALGLLKLLKSAACQLKCQIQLFAWKHFCCYLHGAFEFVLARVLTICTCFLKWANCAQSSLSVTRSQLMSG